MKTAWLSLILLFTACSSAGSNPLPPSENDTTLPPTDLERVHTGVEAPDFTLESTDNDAITLSDYRGKKNVILVFYRGYW